MIRSFSRLVAFALASIAITSANAEVYPSKPINIVVPYNAGGGMDNVIRKMTTELEKELGQPVTVVNQAGAGGNVGTRKLAESAPDGYTIGMSGGSTFGTNQVFNKEVPYDAGKQFEFVSMVGTLPRIVVVSAAGPIKTIDDLKKEALTNPKFTMAAALNSPDILMGEIFKHKMLGKPVIASYGAATNTMMVDLVGGRIHAVWNSVPALNACLTNNTCVALAVTGKQRLKGLPNVPTFAEVGLAEVDAPAYYGIVTPKGVAADKIAKLNRAFNRVIQNEKVASDLDKMGVVTIVSSPAETKEQHLQGIANAKKYAAVANIVAK
jgi:tripartite-type tricarboxylate transporter receptor subunit TctC